jgi:ectoine hydroxylase-related dioxygenase (phytanoyl-CoA dioxygenase family)
MINVMWALDDFTAENGATRIWPRSHIMAPDSTLPEDESIKVVMPRGSAAIFLGSTLHAGGANNSTVSRRGLIVSYCQAWLKPWENQWLAYPPEIARTFSPEIAKLVGYQQLAPTLGNFEGQCPSILLREPDADLLSFTDLLTPEQQDQVREYQRQHALKIAA